MRWQPITARQGLNGSRGGWGHCDSSLDQPRLRNIQIAYWTGPSGGAGGPNDVTRVEAKRAGVFDFFKTVIRMGDDDPGGADEALYRSYMKPECEYREWRTHQMSDHLPMWVELCIDFGDEYLQSLGESE